MINEQEQCLTHTPPCIRVNGEWVPQNGPTRQDTFTKVLQALMDAYGVKIISTDDLYEFDQVYERFVGVDIDIRVSEDLNPK